MRTLGIAAVCAVAACGGPETTSFRTTDRGDGLQPGAAYNLRDGAIVHVTSNGGYIASSDEAMTHVGFEIRNTSKHTVVFDGDALALALFDKHGAPLPAARFVSVTPLGPAQVPIASGTTKTLDAQFLLPVRPRVVDTMRVSWTLGIDDARDQQVTSFVRDDDYPVSEPPARVDPTHPST